MLLRTLIKKRKTTELGAGEQGFNMDRKSKNLTIPYVTGFRDEAKRRWCQRAQTLKNQAGQRLESSLY